MSAYRRLRLALAADPAAQLRLLWVFFFCAETASYLLGVLSTTLLVKRAGAARLPQAYLVLNAAFLPIILAVLSRPPRSSLRALRASLGAYVAATFCTLPGAWSSRPAVLIATYVVARLGKLLWSTFAVGMVAEILPLREAKAAVPYLLAAASSGVVLAGLALRTALDTIQMGTAFVGLWLMLVLSLAVLLLLPASEREEEPAAPRESIGKTLSRLMSDRLARAIALQNLFVVGLRYSVEFTYAGALGDHFRSERSMAGFAGGFEAAMQLSITLVQLTLTGWLMRVLRVGGLALALPLLLLAATGVALFTDAFWAILMCQFLFWVGSDGFNKPVRQVLMGAMAPALLPGVPVLMAVLGLAGSFGASAMLLPLAWLGGPRLVTAATFLASAAFLAVSVGLGRTYGAALSQTLAQLDGEERGRVLSRPWAAGGEDARFATLAELVRSPNADLRLEAIRSSATLHGDAAGGLLMEGLETETDPRVKAAFISALSDLRPSGLLRVLLGSLGDSDARVRANALEALAGYPNEPACSAAVERGLASPEARVRAAAVLAAIRLAAGPRMLERALDTLLAMLGDSGNASQRTAALFAMGRMGYPFLTPAIQEALSDGHPDVRRTAAEALIRMRAPAAARDLTAALARETDERAAEAMREALVRLHDDNVGTILLVVDFLTGPERAQVSEMIAAGPQDGRMELLRDAVLVEQPRVRAELVGLVRELKDARVLEALHGCIHERGEEERVVLAPLLFYLENGPAGGSEEGYAALRRLAPHSDPEELAEHLTRVSRRLWTLALVEAMLAARSAAGGVSELQERASSRLAAALDHLVAVAGATTRRPERAVEVMRAALRGDRYRASLSCELAEQWIPPGVRQAVLPVLEAFGDPVRRLVQARKTLGFAEGSGAGEDFLRHALAGEGLTA